MLTPGHQTTTITNNFLNACSGLSFMPKKDGNMEYSSAVDVFVGGHGTLPYGEVGITTAANVTKDSTCQF